MEMFEVSDLLNPSDNALFEEVLSRTEEKVDQFDDYTEGIRTLPHAVQVFYVTTLYEMEVNNGGLCQFFVNSSREFAPVLAGYLGEIGASEHKALFEAFVHDNDIDVNDLSSFIIDELDGFETQAKRYPFDDFDDAFYAMKPIEELIVPYIRAHIEEFRR